MQYQELLQELKKGQTRPLYLLYGEETYLIRQLEQQIINILVPPADRDMQLTVLEQDPGINEWIERVETVPFFGGRNVLLIRNSQWFGGGKKNAQDEGCEEERLLACLANMPEYACVIWSTEAKADKRRKLYKTVDKQGAVVELSPLKARDVRPWLEGRMKEAGRQLTTEAMEYWLSIIHLMPQVSLGFLDNEWQKLLLYTDAKRIGKPELETVLASLPEVSVFAMLDAITQKQTAQALELLKTQLAAGEHPLRLIALLARQIRQLWQAQELAAAGYQGRDAAEALGVVPFIAEKMLRQSRLFPAAVLEQALHDLAIADYGFKSGQANSITLEAIVIQLCQATPHRAAAW